MKSMFLMGMSAFIVAATGLYFVLEPPEWPTEMSLIAPKPPPPVVTVFLVGDRRAVSMMRSALDPARIVAETPDAIALIEGRVIAANVEAVSDPVNQAGWAERKIELFTLRRDNGLERGRKGARGGEMDERRTRLNELAKKPTLTPGEAIFVLNAMDDGLI
ncbi:MAG: hypothetical protein V3T33_11265 [Myxococcota bacterium]